jgi:hypothetical protein
VITEPPEDSVRLGALRLEIDGSWSVQEFQALLLTINDVYNRVATTMMLGALVREEQRRNDAFRRQERNEQINWAWESTYYGLPRHFEGEFFFQRQPLPKALEAVRPFTAPLAIDALRLESPGWVQIMGNLNPLKVIADFIAKWRAENTKRMKIQSEERRTEGALAFERERMHRGFALEVLRQMPESDRHRAAERLSEIAEYSITPSISELERVATDTRVGNAEIVELGAPLPNERGGPKTPRSRSGS